MINLSSNSFDNTNFFNPNAQALSRSDPMQVDSEVEAFDYQKIVDAKETKQFVADCLSKNQIELLKKFYEKIDDRQFWIALNSLAAFYRQDEVKADAVFADLGYVLQTKDFKTWSSLKDLVNQFLKDPLKTRCVYAPNSPIVFEDFYEKYAERVKNAPATIPSDEILALVFGDGFIHGTKYEGASRSMTVEFLIPYLKYFSENNFFPEIDFTETINDFVQLLELSRKFDSFNNDPKMLAPVVRMNAESVLTTLKQKGRAIIPGGWIDKFNAHAMIYLVEREPSNDPLKPYTYSFSIFSTGAGSEYHLMKRVRNNVKIVPCETIPQIPAKKIENVALFEYLLTLAVVMPKNTDAAYNQLDIYPVLFNYFDYQPRTIIDVPPEAFSVPQSSGTCAWKVLLAYIRTRLGASFCEKFKFHLKTLMLFQTSKQYDGQPGISKGSCILLEESLRCYHFAAIRALNAGAISYEDFYVAHSMKQHIKLPSTTRDVVMPWQTVPNPLSSIEFEHLKPLTLPPLFSSPAVTNFSLAKLSPSLNCHNPDDLIKAMDRLIMDGEEAYRAGLLLELEFILCPFFMDLPRLDHFEGLVQVMDEEQLFLARSKFKELLILFSKISYFDAPGGKICRSYLHILNYLLHKGAIREQLGDEVFDKVVFLDPAMDLRNVTLCHSHIGYINQINEFYKNYPAEKSIYFKRHHLEIDGRKLELECYEFDHTDPKYILYDLWKDQNQLESDPFVTPYEFSKFFLGEDFLGWGFKNYQHLNYVLKTWGEAGVNFVFDENHSTSTKAIFLCTSQGRYWSLCNFAEAINQAGNSTMLHSKPPLEITRLLGASYMRLPLFINFFEKNINYLLTDEGYKLFQYCLYQYSYEDPIGPNFLVRELKSSNGKKIIDRLNRFILDLAEFSKANDKPTLMFLIADLQLFIKKQMELHELGEFNSAITEEHLDSLKNHPTPIHKVMYLAFLLWTKGEKIFEDAHGMHSYLEAYFQEPINSLEIVNIYYELKKETARLEPIFWQKWMQVKDTSVYLDVLCKNKFPDFSPVTKWQGMYLYFNGDYLIDFDRGQILFKKNKQTSFAGYLNSDYSKITWSTAANDFTETKLGFQSKTAGLEIRFMNSPVFVRTKEQLLVDFPNCHWPAGDFKLDQEYVFIPHTQAIPAGLTELDLTAVKELPQPLKSVKLEKWSATNGSHMILKGKGVLYLIYKMKNSLLVRDVVEKRNLVNIKDPKNCRELFLLQALEPFPQILVWKSDDGNTCTFHLPRFGLTFTKSGNELLNVEYLNQKYGVWDSVRILNSMWMMHLRSGIEDNILLLPKRTRVLVNQQNSPLDRSTFYYGEDNPDLSFELATYRLKDYNGGYNPISACEGSKQDLIFLITCLITATLWDEAIKVIKKCYQNYPFAQPVRKMILHMLDEGANEKKTLPRNLSAALCHLLWLFFESENHPHNIDEKFRKIYLDYIKNYNSIPGDWRLTPSQEFSMQLLWGHSYHERYSIIPFHVALQTRTYPVKESGLPYRNDLFQPIQKNQLYLENTFSSLGLLPDFKLADLSEKYGFNIEYDRCFLNLLMLFLEAHKQKDEVALLKLQLTVLNYLNRTKSRTRIQFNLRSLLYFLAKSGIGEIDSYEDISSDVALKKICEEIWVKHKTNLSNLKQDVFGQELIKGFGFGQINTIPERKEITFNQLQRNYERFSQVYLSPSDVESSQPQANKRKRRHEDAIPLEDREGKKPKARKAKEKALGRQLIAKKLTTKQLSHKTEALHSKWNDSALPFCLDTSFNRLRENQGVTTSALQFYSSLKKDFLEHSKPKEHFAYITPEFIETKLRSADAELRRLLIDLPQRQRKLFNRTFWRVFPKDSTETFRRKIVGHFVDQKTRYAIDFILLLNSWFLVKDPNTLKPEELEVYEETKQIIQDTLNQILNKKIIACGKQVLAALAKENQSGVRELQHTFHSLLNTTFLRENQLDPHLSLKLFYQSLSGIILRPKQMEIVSKVDGFRQVALQLGCGEGKTKVLTAIFDLMKLKEQRLVLNVLMPNNFKLNLAEFERQANTFGVFNVKVFDFHRNINDQRDMKNKYRILKDAKEFGDVVVTQPKSIQSLGLKYIELLNDAKSDPVSIRYVESMLGLIMDEKNCTAIMDEIHQLLKQQDQLNYALASSEVRLPKYRWQVPVQIVHALLEYNQKQENPLDIIPIGPYANEQFSGEVYQDRLKERLARFLFTKAAEFGIKIEAGSKEMALWVKYMSTNAEDLSVEERKKLKAWLNSRVPEEVERLQLLRAHLLVYLKHTLNARCFVNYGPSDQTHQPVPYKYNMFSEDKNRFEYYDTLVNLTCFMYLKTGLSQAQVKLFLEGWQQIHLNQRRTLGDKSEKTAIEQRFATFLPDRNLGVLNLEDKDVLNEITPKIAFNLEIIFEFMRVYIFEGLTTQGHRLNSNAQDLAGTLLGEIIGFSGIFTNDHNFPIDMECKYHPGTYAKILSQLLDPSVTSLACPQTSEDEAKLYAGAHVVLDPNAYHEGVPNLTVAKTLLAAAPKEIQTVLFYNELNEICNLDRQEKVTPYKTDGDNPKSRITFYDHGHHEEVDIIQPDDGSGILLVNNNLTFTQLYQAAKRLRGLGAGQRLVVLIPKKVENFISRKIQEPITMESLIAWTVMNEGETNEKTKLPALLDQLRNVYSSRLMRMLVELSQKPKSNDKERNSLFAKNKELLIQKQDVEHFKAIASLNAPLSDIQTFMCKAKKLEKKYSRLLLPEDHEKLGRIMQKANEELGSPFGNRLDGFFNATSQQEQEIQLENQVVRFRKDANEVKWNPEELFKDKNFVDNLEKNMRVESIPDLFAPIWHLEKMYVTNNFLVISRTAETKKGEPYLEPIEFLVEFESSTCSKILIVTLKEAEVLRLWMILNKKEFTHFNIALYTANGDLLEKVDNAMSDQSIIRKNGNRIFAQINYLNGNVFCAPEVRESMRAWTSKFPEYYDDKLRRIQKKQVMKGVRKFITGLDPLYET